MLGGSIVSRPDRRQCTAGIFARGHVRVFDKFICFMERCSQVSPLHELPAVVWGREEVRVSGEHWRVAGGASVVSRLLSSWAAGRPKVSSTLLSAVTLVLAGVTVCVMPYWGSLIGQIILMVIYGLTVSPFFSLTSIIICDILDLEALTNAYGIVTMVRGIASTVGSPVAGMIVAATSVFWVALLIAGGAVIVGGVLCVAILFHERAKLNKQVDGGVDTEQGK
ncbi:Monocarboxylate transporter 9 [Echinococcus granulosus]|uniref:Monocarboxylate transporter 9 n=1 Tax=Echinococcus granulosus TaxID=6210 RepID=W6ULJ6_ECHGR|nr:Monocarboxylate transporter 9 [Echinococcus granulosus]EUB61996.1 Monocarboxylate transporter 9 [Echinococcus granulosus]